MTNKEFANRNIGLTFDFVNYLIDNPEILVDLPDKFKLEFIEKDFSKIEKKRKEETISKTTKKYVKVRNQFELAS
ncbi:MAG: hypothetical protein B6D61_00235 [Bacteroidetes bacterium 4484_249]|nr:MAG: hypothetical protein B6D61_00235 [Bacteroidetes bacterium 4484_249]